MRSIFDFVKDLLFQATLGDVLPAFAADYVANLRLRDAESGCELPLGNVAEGVAISNLVDFHFSELGAAVGFPLRMISSVFRFSVRVVIGLRTEPQVSRIRAGRVVAGVEYTKPSRDLSKNDLPDGSVNSHSLAFAHELSVAVFVPIALELPTTGVGLEVAQAFDKRLHEVLPEKFSQESFSVMWLSGIDGNVGILWVGARKQEDVEILKAN